MDVHYPTVAEARVRYVRKDSTERWGCAVRHDEESIEIEFAPATGFVQLGVRRYELLQTHFHTPSEHVVSGRRYPVEQHFVHRDVDTGSLLVVGLLLTGGGTGGTVADLVLRRPPTECADPVTVGGLPLHRVFPADLSTFRYSGSLTTTPYTEGVQWLVLRHPARVLTRTLARLWTTFPRGNSRELQPLNGRAVSYRPQPQNYAVSP